MLVNNAGVASVSPLLSADVDQMQRMIELNTVASPASHTPLRPPSCRVSVEP